VAEFQIDHVRVSPAESLRLVIFYALSALLALFCVIALGFGPEFFVLVGAALAVWAFRRRRRSWWGLALSAAGAVEAIGAASGLAGHDVVYATVAVFVAVIVLRITALRWGRAERARPMTGGPTRGGPGYPDF
jgi:Kef-type K+ transport system membrane component KefB